MTIYLSGPMTGLPNYNRDYFNRVAERLRSEGHTVFNPAENTDSDHIYPRSHYLRQDIRALLDCDTILMLPGWGKSAGARLELEIAKELELTVFFYDEAKTKDDTNA